MAEKILVVAISTALSFLRGGRHFFLAALDRRTNVSSARAFIGIFLFLFLGMIVLTEWRRSDLTLIFLLLSLVYSYRAFRKGFWILGGFFTCANATYIVALIAFPDYINDSLLQYDKEREAARSINSAPPQPVANSPIRVPSSETESPSRSSEEIPRVAPAVSKPAKREPVPIASFEAPVKIETPEPLVADSTIGTSEPPMTTPSLLKIFSLMPESGTNTDTLGSMEVTTLPLLSHPPSESDIEAFVVEFHRTIKSRSLEATMAFFLNFVEFDQGSFNRDQTNRLFADLFLEWPIYTLQANAPATVVQTESEFVWEASIASTFLLENPSRNRRRTGEVTEHFEVRWTGERLGISSYRTKTSQLDESLIPRLESQATDGTGSQSPDNPVPGLSGLWSGTLYSDDRLQSLLLHVHSNLQIARLTDTATLQSVVIPLRVVERTITSEFVLQPTEESQTDPVQVFLTVESFATFDKASVTYTKKPIHNGEPEQARVEYSGTFTKS